MLEILLSHGKIPLDWGRRKNNLLFTFSRWTFSFHTCPSVPESPEVVIGGEQWRVSQGEVCMFANTCTCFLVLHLPYCDVLYYLRSVLLRLRLDGYFIHTSSVQRLHFLVVWYLVFILFLVCMSARVLLSLRHPHGISAKLIILTNTLQSCLLFYHHYFFIILLHCECFFNWFFLHSDVRFHNHNAMLKFSLVITNCFPLYRHLSDLSIGLSIPYPYHQIS